MASKKKTWRITVALVCKECWATNYHTSINKGTTTKLEVKKYCNKSKTHTLHGSKEKLK